MNSEIEIYQSSDGQTEVQVTFDNDTVWLNQDQLGKLFDRDRTVIGRHIKNIFNEGELDENMVCADFAHTTQHGAIEGKTQTKATKYYNLDVIISVGYRVKSIRGTQFRQWASSRLKDYLILGYSINEKRLEQKNQEIKVLKSGLQILSRALEETAQEEGFQWLAQFTKGLTLLDDYDHERLDSKGLSLETAHYPTRNEYQSLINQMKLEFESDVFGIEKDKSFESAIGQISKGFGERDFYPSIEEKAATLLYLIIKNHAFADGNKRIAAACFLLFLETNNALSNNDGTLIISNEALASITLFAAASKPDEMDVVKNLIVSILNRNK
ncbi:Fic/DOC family protein [Owenweeksia hongkongensis DSM 17368]|uniref:Fic/DOC family protein n=1 Tax=Owenweeksia hongkongensis (strain DSM 17368 / CIP 108786 / JCM 12287 / NRRL B-23963 / UST20020801) TaxID=926562 RepID=G8R5I4_OWEHD|nr:RhuM family protein [Owenweeksia hongkongensis]AEV33258.1 Fic/DOC family protein [Owenweeksia hongkongensis DSM 17368]